MKRQAKQPAPPPEPALEAQETQEARAPRSLRGAWAGLAALLGAALVLFYLYTAGLASVGTQYHRGVYVGITYVLIFLLYPGGGVFRWASAALVGALGAVWGAVFLAFGDFASLHQEIEAWLAAVSAGGSGAQESAASLGFWAPLALVVAALVLAGILWFADRRWEERWPGHPTLLDLCLAAASAGTVGYWIQQFEDLNYRAGAETDLDALVSVVGVLLSLEVCRRVLGWSLTLVGAAMLAYGYFGAWLPDLVAHRGFGLERLATSLFLTTNGVFGVMANVLATYVILFIFFGAFLHASGAGKFFIDLPMAVAGRTTGGAAKVAVLASALFGSVSGSAIANTVSTGTFTIPLMKKAGFRPQVAGAIEPAASIGGMLLPPIMGAGGFLMAELTEIPYARVMLIAVFPALLYFLSVFCMVHFEAKKHGIRGFEAKELTPWRTVLRRDWLYSLPLVLITVLLLWGRSPAYCAFWATLSCIAVSWSRRQTRMGPREIWAAIQSGARSTLTIGATLGVIGIVVGTISLTGIGLKFSDIVLSLARGDLLLALVLVALASLVLGMGVPVTAAYLITAVLAVPALTDLGVVLIAAHMIVYWLSQDSNITPPVCVAAYAGAAIAGSDPWKTGWTAFKFAKLLYVMPILFAFTPALLLEGKPLVAPPLADAEMGAMVLELRTPAGQAVEAGQVVAVLLDGEDLREVKASQGGVLREWVVAEGSFVQSGVVLAQRSPKPWQVASAMLSALLGTLAFSALSMGYFLHRLSWVEGGVLAVATFLLYWPGLLTDALGLVLVAAVYLWQKRGSLPAGGPNPGSGTGDGGTVGSGGCLSGQPMEL